MRRPDVRATLAADGFILVAVLWILAALAALASVYSIHIANTAGIRADSNNRLQTEALITAGLELTAFRVIGFDDATRPQVRAPLPSKLEGRILAWNSIPRGRASISTWHPSHCSPACLRRWSKTQ